MKKNVLEITLVSEELLRMPIVIIIPLIVAIIIIAGLNSNYLDEAFIRLKVSNFKEKMRSLTQP